MCKELERRIRNIERFALGICAIVSKGIPKETETALNSIAADFFDTIREEDFYFSALDFEAFNAKESKS